METFAAYLLKSVIWTSGFAVVFILFLRNERFFYMNRIYLLAGILTSFIFPLISIHYTIELPVIRNFQSETAVVNQVQEPVRNIIPDLKLIVTVLYLSGILFVLTLILKRAGTIVRVIKKSEIISLSQIKLIKTPDYASAFSFFSYVFVNPSVTDIEAKEIVNHELVHIRQKHWFDLLLVELLCMMQWFNPVVWIYVRFIRQNHEYLADEVALQRTSDPAIYKAVLLNQIVGASVVSLTNSFNYSPNKKRFNMMKNIISSPYRKMKILLILPVFAIVLYAFAKPDYKYKFVDNSSGNYIPSASIQQHEVKGRVVQQDGQPLPGASIVVQGTFFGASADAKGYFKIDNVPDNGLLVVSFVGFKSKVLKPVFNFEMIINLVRDTVKFLNENITTPPPPPVPLTRGINIRVDGLSPLYVVDGIVMTKTEAEKIDPNSIESINVKKSKSTTDKYGEQGKDGVIEIITKKDVVNVIESVPPVKETPALQETSTPPPPPPPIPFHFKVNGDGPPPLFVVDGTIITETEAEKIDPESIESITVLKAKSATEKPLTDKYGEKGKNGVIEIKTRKKNSQVNERPTSYVEIYADTLEFKNDSVVIVEETPDQRADKNPFVIVEEMPSFPGGKGAMQAWIADNLQYPAVAMKNKITGKVYVTFIVSKTGKVKNVVVSKSASPLLDAEAKRVISGMPDWKPGSQAGKSVDVRMQVPVEFILK